jgi:hypothetical protein
VFDQACGGESREPLEPQRELDLDCGQLGERVDAAVSLTPLLVQQL